MSKPGPLTEHEKDAVAKMAVSGVSYSQIAAVTRRTARGIGDLLRAARDGENTDMAARIDRFEGVVVREAANHRFEMLEEMSTARRNIRDGMRSDDLRVRLETSWKLIDHLVPKAVQRHEIDVGGKIDINTSIEMNETLKVIESQLPALAAAAGNFKKRIKQGPEALPGPPTEVKGNGREKGQ